MSDDTRKIIEDDVVTCAFVNDVYHVKTAAGHYIVLHHGPAQVLLAQRSLEEQAEKDKQCKPKRTALLKPPQTSSSGTSST